MGRIHLDAELAEEYQQLFQNCQILPAHTREIDQLISDIITDRLRYEAVGQPLGIPWQVIAAVHYAATERNFEVHPHNGDPLTRRTVHEPDGHPQHGEPPFSWEQSATDYLRLLGFDKWDDWSLAGTLYKLEGLGGWAYRLHLPKRHSPYLWCGSQHYQGGKFVTDELWSDDASYAQYGAAVLLRRLAEQDLIRKAAAAHMPVLGHCLGGQMIAKALGATIGPKARKAMPLPSRRTTPLPSGSARSSGSITAPGPPPRG